MRILFISLAAAGALALTGVDGCHSPTQPGGGTTTALDTTSHNFTYYIDTLPFSGQLNDVAIINDTCVYAVGAYYAPTDTFQTHLYNVARWDGTKWNYIQVYYDTINKISDDFYSVYAFGTNDVVVADIGPYIWNGKTWTDYVYPNFLNTRNIHKIWGTSDNDLFMAGDGGTILRRKITSYTLMPSGTTDELTDIFGISDTEIYACGVNSSFDEGILLKYNGLNWQTMISGVFPIDTAQLLKTELEGIIATAWKNDSGEIYTGGDFIWNYIKGQWNLTTGIGGNNLQHANRTYGEIGLIRGNNWNDIAAFGDFQSLLHFSGNTWNQSTGFVQGSGLSYLAGDMKGNFIVGVGVDNNSGKPIAIRLYRQ